MFIRTFLDACHSLDFVEPRTDAKSYLWAEISVVTQASEGHDSFITEVQEVGRTKLRIISHSDQPSKALRGLCSDEASDHEPVTGESIPRHHPSEQPSLMPCAPKGIATSYDTIVPVARRPEMSSQWAASFLTAITDHDTLGEEGPKESLVQKSSAATMLNPGQITSVTRFLEEVPPQRHTLDFTFGKLCLLWSDCVGYCLPRTFHIHHSLYNKLGLSRIQPLLGKRTQRFARGREVGISGMIAWMILLHSSRVSASPIPCNSKSNCNNALASSEFDNDLKFKLLKILEDLLTSALQSIMPLFIVAFSILCSRTLYKQKARKKLLLWALGSLLGALGVSQDATFSDLSLACAQASYLAFEVALWWLITEKHGLGQIFVIMSCGVSVLLTILSLLGIKCLGMASTCITSMFCLATFAAIHLTEAFVLLSRAAFYTRSFNRF